MTVYWLPSMYTSLLSTLLIGLVPLWSATEEQVPVLSIDIAAPVPFSIRENPLSQRLSDKSLTASGVLIMDLSSGQNLYEYASMVERPIASLTKLMTALIIAENHSLDELVDIPEDVRSVPGNIAYLTVGSRFTVGDLLSALLIGSANDAAFVLAMFHSDTTARFVEEMNQRAKVLGLNHTLFANPAGLDAPDQWSTPRDVGWLVQYVLRSPPIRERLSSRGARITSMNGEVIYLTHTHALLHADTPVIAGKTGTTDAAGECLVSVVEWQGRHIVVVLLGSRDRYADMRTILDALMMES